MKTNAGWWIPIGTPGGRWRFSITVIVATAIAAVAGIRGVVRVARRRATATDAALAVIGITVVSVTIVGNLFEIGENNRFRFMVEPITFVALTWFLTRVGARLVAWWRARGSHEPAASPEEPAPTPARVGGSAP